MQPGVQFGSSTNDDHTKRPQLHHANGTSDVKCNMMDAMLPGNSAVDEVFAFPDLQRTASYYDLRCAYGIPAGDDFKPLKTFKCVFGQGGCESEVRDTHGSLHPEPLTTEIKTELAVLGLVSGPRTLCRAASFTG